MEVDSTVKPVQLPKRRVPVALMKPLKEELRDLQHRGIITPVECSTDWISAMVVVQKRNGKQRCYGQRLGLFCFLAVFMFVLSLVSFPSLLQGRWWFRGRG